MLRGRSVMEGAFFCAPVFDCAGAARAQTPQQKAWELLRTGESARNSTKRVAAAKALGVLIDDPLAEMLAGKALAGKALKDRNSSVRAAAATSLRNWKKALLDEDSQVSFAATDSLVALCGAAGYDFYLEFLTGERKTGQGLISDQVAILKDPRKMARLGFETGIGFPDSDHGIEGALLGAASSKRWTVRVPALNAIAQQGGANLLAKVVPREGQKCCCHMHCCGGRVETLAGDGSSETAAPSQAILRPKTDANLMPRTYSSGSRGTQ
jgi:hypothetical protein